MIQGVFGDVLILLAAAVLVVALFRRFNLPPILAYLVVGVIVGQQSLGGISVSEDAHFLAELGVVFLMFSIGLEFSLPRLLSMKGVVLGLGGAQVVVSTLAGALVAFLLGMTPQGALVVGGLLAMSSTAIVSKQLAEQVEIHSRHGRFAMGILLFQDLAVIPFLVVIPTLAISASGATAMPLLWALTKGVLVSALLLAAGHWLLRPLFREVAARHSAELFMLTVLLVTLTAAWATQQAGLSLVLGAFLAGMMLGETEFRHQVEADIRPFQHVLLGLFFITIGMRLDITALPAIWFWALLVTVGLVLFKTALIAGLTRFAGAERGVALRSGLVLAHSGEFSFVLLSLALDNHLMDGQASQIVLAAVLLSMALSPLLIRYNGALAKRFFGQSYGRNRAQMEEAISTSTRAMTQHIIICGYGRVGQNIARQLEQEGFEFVALDMDPLRVREAREAGDAVNYGNSTRQGMLEAAGLDSARALIISFQDIAASLKILGHVRRLRPELPVLVRTRDDTDLDRLQAAGATEVVPETLEASLMLASHLLLILGVPMSKIVRRMREVHNDRYRLLRGFFPGADQAATGSLEAQRERLHTVALEEGAFGVGRTLGELGLDKLGVVATAVRRSGIRGIAPEPSTLLRVGDVLVLYGTPPDLARVETLLLRG
ncbi:MAG: cation:proton antiporter [Proteobacteria bacterium]|nr:cation:proton antiporter [Pseudomonadota bacterium]